VFNDSEGNPSEEKAVQYAMSYMALDSAAQWSQRESQCESDTSPFPFPTWISFETQFCLRFIEENEQDHTQQKLESWSYYMGNCDVYKYSDEFEDLVDIAKYVNPLVKVTKYQAGLDPGINNSIATICM
jgi:hypothetical protein